VLLLLCAEDGDWLREGSRGAIQRRAASIGLSAWPRGTMASLRADLQALCAPSTKPLAICVRMSTLASAEATTRKRHSFSTSPVHTSRSSARAGYCCCCCCTSVFPSLITDSTCSCCPRVAPVVAPSRSSGEGAQSPLRIFCWCRSRPYSTGVRRVSILPTRSCAVLSTACPKRF